MQHDLIVGAVGAAAFTGLSQRKIYRLVEEGHVPVVRKGRRLYFRKSELMRAFSSHAPRTGAGETMPTGTPASLQIKTQA